MEYIAARKSDLYRLFGIIDIPNRVAAPIIEDFYRWLDNNGPEWTVRRIKALKTLYLQHYGGVTTFRLEESEGVKCHSDGTPYGPFRALWTMGTSHRIVNRIMTVLMTYSSVRIKGEPTNSQFEKFSNAVEFPRPAGVLPPWEFLDPRFIDAYSLIWHESHYDLLEKWTNDSGKKVLYPPVKPERLHEHGRVIMDDYLTLPETSLAIDDHIAQFLMLNEQLLSKYEFLINKGLGRHAYPNRWRAVRTGMLGFLEREFRPRSNFKTIYDWSRESPIVGKIGFIQERGCKLRSVANPMRVVQCVLSRMHNWLAIVSQRILPWDCTFNQDKGVEWASRMLAQGKKLYSFDLSNASDTIPLEDQINFLKAVGPKNNEEFNSTLAFFEEVSKGIWIVKRSNFHPIRPIRWAKGQPMGLVSSFGSFAHCHGARLRELSHALDLPNGLFVVLGDDVIVSEELAPAYHDFVVNKWGCDISESKTIASNSLSEFASRLITPGRQIAAKKYPNSTRMFSTRNPLELPVKYGKKALKLVPSRYRPMVQVATTLPRPHGLGWIPESGAVLPDARAFESILYPRKLEQVSDVSYALKYKQLGATFYSWEVRDTRKVDRFLDVEVAFSTEKSLGTLYGRFKLVFKTARDKEHTQPMVPLSAVPYQWSVLHHNANLENKEYADHKPLQGEELADFRVVVGTRSSPFEVVPESKNPMTILNLKVRHWLRYIYGFVGKSLHKFTTKVWSYKRNKRAKPSAKR